MPIYVDDARIHGVVRNFIGRWSHLFAVPHDAAELTNFAKNIGLHPSWIHNGSYPHFDVTDKFRDLAIDAGATPVTRDEVTVLLLGEQLEALCNNNL